jgi:predicted phage terminase large subunit-like protein
MQVEITKAKAEKCKRDFFYFIQEFWNEVIPDTPHYNWHMPYLCAELQKISLLVINRQAKEYDLGINVPPGTSKSTICTVMLPAWIWTIDPTIRVLTSSYSSSLSLDHATRSRDIIQSDKYKSYFGDIQLKADQNNKGHYKNTKGGERYATSVTGTITGFHAHLIIVDDPLNAKEASSEVERKSANDFMDTTLSTRKVDKEVTPTILIMQRLHENDPMGNWLSKKGKKLKHICLPAELSDNVEPKELEANYVNGLLDPIRLSKNVLEDMKIDLGSYGYAGQMMQSPAPIDGGIWKRWFKVIPDNEIPTNLMSLGTDWDLAYTEKETNSASAYVTSGKVGKDMFVTDVGFEWLEFPQLINYMKDKKAPHYIEAKASGKSAKQSLSQMGIPAIEVKVNGGDKIARATQATPFAEAGMIYVAESLINKLYHDDKQGILRFPNNKHDDLNDALVQAINRLLVKHREFVVI